MLNDDLRAELSKLYPNTDSARRIVDEAGIPSVFIDFEGTAADVWHRIVKQADSRRMLPDLIRVAVKEFPSSIVLQRALGAFIYDPHSVDSKVEKPLMSDRWGGSFEDTARLRERVSVIETNMTRIDRHLVQLGEGQAENRRYTETKFAEITTLIKASPIAPMPKNDRLFVAVIVIGAIVTAILLLFIAYWVYILTGGRLT